MHDRLVSRRIDALHQCFLVTVCSECLSFPHCQYTASLDLDTFPEISARQLSEITTVKRVYFHQNVLA